jgi:hypothetical protein
MKNEQKSLLCGHFSAEVRSVAKTKAVLGPRHRQGRQSVALVFCLDVGAEATVAGEAFLILVRVPVGTNPLRYPGFSIMPLTTRQKQAIDHHHGNLQLIACPGSGKTEVVARRGAEILKTGKAKPGNIVAFTSTDKAAAELKERITTRCNQVLGQVTAGSFAAANTLQSQSRYYQVLLLQSRGLMGSPV